MGKINWWAWKLRCPICGSINIDKLNKYRNIPIQIRGRWKMKEQQKCKCSDCGNEFWKK